MPSWVPLTKCIKGRFLQWVAGTYFLPSHYAGRLEKNGFVLRRSDLNAHWFRRLCIPKKYHMQRLMQFDRISGLAGKTDDKRKQESSGSAARLSLPGGIPWGMEADRKTSNSGMPILLNLPLNRPLQYRKPGHARVLLF